jgi:endonuclease/exonuclease/phosphatase family metal-dependent hydrolase
VAFLFQHFQVDGLQNLRLTPRAKMAGADNGSASIHGSLAMAGDIANPGGRPGMTIPRVTHNSLPSTSQTASKPYWASTPIQPDRPRGDAIRIASFNLQVFNDTKARKGHVIELLATMLRSFDVICLQEISGREQDLLPRLVDHINRSGVHYDYLIGPRVGRGTASQQLAFLFDTETLETDRYQLYTVDDPQELLSTEPLVAWFRCRRVPADQAFTFSLVNMHIDMHDAQRELALLSELVRGVMQDGRNEDDCILAGDFSSSDREMRSLASAGLQATLSGVPTHVQGTQMLDNILIPLKATSEFTGRAGVLDFLREHNLSLDAAMEVSDHMPIWAEFAIVEGGQRGRTLIH